MKLQMTALAAALSIALAGCVDDGNNGTNGVVGANGAGQVITMSRLASTNSQGFAKSAAEIVAFDAANKRVLTINANNGKVDVFDATTLAGLEGANPAQSLDMAATLLAAGKVAGPAVVGAANSIAIHGNLAAIAVEANPKTNTGWVVFIDTATLAYVNAVAVGALPDMVTFTPDGSKVIVANEGEPDEGYVNDPEGSISVIRVSDYNVTTIGFADFNVGGARNAELPATKMILDGYSATNAGNKATVAQSLEPEYIATNAVGTKAYVVLQENNAIAVLDLGTNTVEKIFGLGFKDHAIPGNEMDASQKDGVNIKNWPVMGMYMPDTIAAVTLNGKTYLLTANEGDSREDWLNPIADAVSCAAAGYYFDGGKCKDELALRDIAKSNLVMGAGLAGLNTDTSLGRLKFSYFATKALNGGTTINKLYAYGGRSFSIWDAQTGMQVFDSGSAFERITAQIYGADFNNDNEDNVGDDRSDNKGPEAEGLTVGVINGHTYAFIGLERMGGIMVYDISNPFAPEYVQYINNRDVTVDLSGGYVAAVGDLGPEGLHFVAADKSPNGKPLVIVGNEVSGTATVYQIDIELLQQ